MAAVPPQRKSEHQEKKQQQLQQQYNKTNLHFGGVIGRSSHFSCLNEPNSFDRPSSRMGGKAAAVIAAARAVREESEGHQIRSVEGRGRREGEEENDIPITARAMHKCFSNRIQPASRTKSSKNSKSSSSNSCSSSINDTLVMAHHQQRLPTVHACCPLPEQENERSTPLPPTTYFFHRAAAAVAATGQYQGQSLADERKTLNAPPSGVLRSTVSAALKQQSKHKSTSGATAAGRLSFSPPRKYNNKPMSPPQPDAPSSCSSGCGRRSPPPAQRRTSTSAVAPPVRVTTPTRRTTTTAARWFPIPMKEAMLEDVVETKEESERRREVEVAAGRYQQEVFALTEHAALQEVELRQTQDCWKRNVCTTKLCYWLSSC